jgi:hypothetical protein
MAIKTVGMITSYKGLNPSPVDWLWKQTPQPFGVWKNIQMRAPAAKPDFLLLYNFNDFPGLKKKKPQSRLTPLRQLLQPGTKPQNGQTLDMSTILRGVPKERIVSLVREPPFEKMRAKRIAEYQYAQTYCGYVSGPDDFAPTPDYMPAIWYVGNTFQALDEMAPPPKERSCCWITSGIDRTAEHKRRLGFLKNLREKHLDFDLYGRDLPDWSEGMGQVDNKWNVMAPYYYNMAIENYAENDWYASEKLWDALLAWCLPIYYGGPAADRLIPPDSFLRLPSLDEKGIAYIQEVTATPDAWHERRDAIAEARQVILHKLNLLNWLSDFADKFS